MAEDQNPFEERKITVKLELPIASIFWACLAFSVVNLVLAWCVVQWWLKKIS
jgi:hypothetical protein